MTKGFKDVEADHIRDACGDRDGFGDHVLRGSSRE
jgi:hypothetical protein